MRAQMTRMNSVIFFLTIFRKAHQQNHDIISRQQTHIDAVVEDDQTTS